MTKTVDLFQMHPNGVEISHGIDEFEDVTFLVLNCDEEKTAIQRVRELLVVLTQDESDD